MKNINMENQIKKLNDTVWCKIAPSKIEGVGVFAIRDIPKGTKVGCVFSFLRNPERLYSVSYERFNEIHSEISKLILQRRPTLTNGGYFYSPNDDAELILFMNHSDNFNYEEKTDTVLRDVLKGEELTEDYRRIKDYEKVFKFLKVE